jgi:hypothetical protein
MSCIIPQKITPICLNAPDPTISEKMGVNARETQYTTNVINITRDNITTESDRYSKSERRRTYRGE